MRTPRNTDSPKRNIEPIAQRLPAQQFWGLVIAMFFLMQIPVIRQPVRFLSTWTHEFGHGLGAIITGGQFQSLQVSPDFSGLAYTLTSSDWQRISVLVVGLLGPSLLGVVLLFLARGLNWTRTTLVFLSALLLLSQVWAADLFTRGLLGGLFLVFALCAWKLPNKPTLYLSQLVAIALCLNVPTDFGYFFSGGGVIAGRTYRSDTGQLAALIGGPHWLWGAVLAALSIAILVLGIIASDRMARRKSVERPKAF